MLVDFISKMTGLGNKEIVANRGFVLNSDQSLQSVEKILEQPFRARTNHRLDDENSFVAYANRFAGGESSAIFVDVEELELTLVADYHIGTNTGVDPHWCEHKATYKVPTSPEWDAWTKKDNTLTDRKDFAFFVRDNAQDFADPDAATMETIAKTFTVKRGMKFKDYVNLTNGEVSVEFTKEDHTEVEGRVSFPEKFAIAIPVFVGTDKCKMDCHTHYSLDGGKLKMGYRMNRIDAWKRSEFSELVERVRKEVSAPIYSGTLSL